MQGPIFHNGSEYYVNRVGTVLRAAVPGGGSYHCPSLKETREVKILARRPNEWRYHVPRSQVWEGSRGRQSGNAHLHLGQPLESGRLHRCAGDALCGRSAWYERPANSDDKRCPRCIEMASRYAVIAE